MNKVGKKPQEGVVFSGMLLLAKDFGIVPNTCNMKQLLDVFHATKIEDRSKESTVDVLSLVDFNTVILRIATLFVQQKSVISKVDRFFALLEGARLDAAVTAYSRCGSHLSLSAFRSGPAEK